MMSNTGVVQYIDLQGACLYNIVVDIKRFVLIYHHRHMVFSCTAQYYNYWHAFLHTQSCVSLGSLYPRTHAVSGGRSLSPIQWSRNNWKVGGATLVENVGTRSHSSQNKTCYCKTNHETTHCWGGAGPLALKLGGGGQWPPAPPCSYSTAIIVFSDQGSLNTIDWCISAVDSQIGSTSEPLQFPTVPVPESSQVLVRSPTRTRPGSQEYVAVVPTMRGCVGEGVEMTRVPLTGAMISGQRITERIHTM